MPVLGQSACRLWVHPVSQLESPVAPPGLVVNLPPAGTNRHPWDEAHHLLRTGPELERAGAPAYAEPDMTQQFPTQPPLLPELESFVNQPCADRPHDNNWAVGLPEFGWHLDDGYSQLKTARTRVGQSGRRVRVAILDTGYDPDHRTVPLHLNRELARNFVDGDPADATDPGRHFPTNQPGHGTATLALLAGNRVSLARGPFDDYLGGAPFAEVVPIRIADSVVHFRGSSMAAGIDYAADIGCEVLSVSMGGVPTRQWAEAVNRAYEKGLMMVAAAGNRFGPLPPASIVYPARFNRVVAVCGVTAADTPYYKEGLHRLMQGCFGPPAKMSTAIAAYTPNAPWAIMGCDSAVGFGGGTSSATPQAAAAAALWLQAATIPPDIQPWQRVEAVRHALFTSAHKRNVPDRMTYYGQGWLRAADALNVPFDTTLQQTPPDTVAFPWFRLLGVLETVPTEPTGEDLMYEVEALQLFTQSPDLEKIAEGADPQADTIPTDKLKKVIDAMRTTPGASAALRDRLRQMSAQL